MVSNKSNNKNKILKEKSNIIKFNKIIDSADQNSSIISINNSINKMLEISENKIINQNNDKNKNKKHLNDDNKITKALAINKNKINKNENVKKNQNKDSFIGLNILNQESALRNNNNLKKN